MQGRSELKGKRWFTDAERKQAAVLRQDKTGRAILTILRQLKRLHEVRHVTLGTSAAMLVLPCSSLHAARALHMAAYSS